eukprot:8311384-Pyramimonas_sp.AAC.1
MSTSFDLSIHLSSGLDGDGVREVFHVVCVEAYPTSWCGECYLGLVYGHKGLVTYDVTAVVEAWAATNSRRTCSIPWRATR